MNIHDAVYDRKFAFFYNSLEIILVFFNILAIKVDLPTCVCMRAMFLCIVCRCLHKHTVKRTHTKLKEI